MLNTYLLNTQLLLQNPQAPVSLYSPSDLTTFINSARGQIAGESQCIRAMGNVSLTLNTRYYPFSGVTIQNALALGISGILSVRTIWYQTGQNTGGVSGLSWMTPRTFEEFSLYEMQESPPSTGIPSAWAQFQPGSTGSLFIYPLPTGSGTLQLDCVCYPINLASDSDPEAIPYLWTDAVPYFAAYLALLSAQNGVRTQEADGMFQRYTEFVQRARRGVTPDVLPWQYEQIPIPGGISTQALGMTAQAAQLGRGG